MVSNAAEVANKLGDLSVIEGELIRPTVATVVKDVFRSCKLSELQSDEATARSKISKGVAQKLEAVIGNAGAAGMLSIQDVSVEINTKVSEGGVHKCEQTVTTKMRDLKTAWYVAANISVSYLITDDTVVGKKMGGIESDLIKPAVVAAVNDVFRRYELSDLRTKKLKEMRLEIAKYVTDKVATAAHSAGVAGKLVVQDLAIEDLNSKNGEYTNPE